MGYWTAVQERSFDFLRAFFSPGVVAGLILAFLIAGAVNVFVPKSFILKYLGNGSNKFLAYGVAITAGILISV
jgi:uncharacterized membrane protein YraQ (UPF0718 family)